jgi:hypothetical protein
MTALFGPVAGSRSEISEVIVNHSDIPR